MLSIIIPTLNAADVLPSTLQALMPGVVSGLVKEVIISDGGSQDPVELIADTSGARLIVGEKGRGTQLAAGADVARGQWYLFLHADTVLQRGWEQAAAVFMAEAKDQQAACFTLAFDEVSLGARMVGWGASLRTRLFKLPYGDQGLLISRFHYEAHGGYKALPLFEDVDLIRRITARDGRKGLLQLQIKAVTSAERYRRDGYARRVVKNFRCLVMYLCGKPPADIVAQYR